MSDVSIDIEAGYCDYIELLAKPASQVLVTGECLFYGYWIKNQSSTVADDIQFFDGNVQVGDGHVGLLATVTNGPSIPPIRLRQGLSCTETNGTIIGGVFVRVGMETGD